MQRMRGRVPEYAKIPAAFPVAGYRLSFSTPLFAKATSQVTTQNTFVKPLAVALWLAVGWASPAADSMAQEASCGSLANQFGPIDYRISTDAERLIVERRHFTPGVENLTKGETASVGADLAYTLRVFPNHPRALAAMSRLSRKEKRPSPVGSEYSVECWFERAVRLQPNDANVRIVIGIELLRDGKTKAAIEQLKIAETLAPESPNVHYNLGLAYFDTTDFEASLKHAKRAYELGFPLPGLRDKLQRAGKWQD